MLLLTVSVVEKPLSQCYSCCCVVKWPIQMCHIC